MIDSCLPIMTFQYVKLDVVHTALQAYLRLSADVNVVSSILHTGFDHWLAKEPVLHTHKQNTRINDELFFMKKFVFLT